MDYVSPYCWFTYMVNTDLKRFFYIYHHIKAVHPRILQDLVLMLKLTGNKLRLFRARH